MIVLDRPFRVYVFRSRGFVGVRVGRRYFKARDLRACPLAYTERELIGYKPLVKVGQHYELGVKTT